MLSNTLLPNETLMTYHKGNRYCERTSAAKVDMYNSRHAKKREYDQCYHYHNNTNIREKTQHPQCKFAVGSIKVVMEKLGILPDIKNNKPSIAYANTCFLQITIQRMGI